MQQCDAMTPEQESLIWNRIFNDALALGQGFTEAKKAADQGVASLLGAEPKPRAKLVPLYRLRNNAYHFYTINEAERDSAVADYGYVLEGIACYVYDGPGDS
jgi:hypothetical protein